MFYIFFQQFGPILDVEIIFNERGSKVIMVIYNNYNTILYIYNYKIYILIK